MNMDEQLAAFEEDLCRLIERYVNEFDIPMAAIIGLLQLRIHDICTSAYEDSEDE